MAPPRYRGYGFRNIGGWEVRDNCARAGRNLNIASSGALIYLISGAKVQSLSFGGASLEISHPSAFVVFALVAFGWLAYRFLLAYRDAADTDPWWHLYLRDIVLVRHPITTYVANELKRNYAPRGISFSMSHSAVVKDFGLARCSVIVPEVTLDQDIVAKNVEIRIPTRELVRAHAYCFPRYLISNIDIADMWVPWLLFFIAIVAIVAEVNGVGPAGLYGLLPARSA